MCDFTNEPGDREAHMTVLQRDENGTPTIWCDPCLTPLVHALNEGGIPTVASCCGHGKNDPSIALADGRWLTVTTGAPVGYEYRATPGEPTDAQRANARNAIHRALASNWMTVANALGGDQAEYEAMLDTIADAVFTAGQEEDK